MDTKRTVLVVDDDKEVLESTVLLLEALGYEAIPLDDPGDVHTVAAREEPGLILQDLRMQGLNISGLVATLRSDPATSDIPLVFFSADAEVAHAASRYHTWGFLRKPFGERQLRQVLDDVFQPQTGATVRQARREVRDAFHEQWNQIAALTNYIEVLRLQGGPDAQRAATAVEDTLLRLEAGAERLQRYMEALLRGLEAEEEAVAPAESRPPRPSGPARASDAASHPAAPERRPVA